MNDLTTLSTVKAWVTVTGDDDDRLLTSLIRQVSQTVLAYLNRQSITKKSFVEAFTGSGGASKMLRNYPVLSVDSVKIAGQAVPTSSFWYDPADDEPPGRLQTLNLTDSVFCRAPCVIAYTAGYFVSAEPQVAAESVFVDGPYGAWMVDAGVSYAAGGALTLVPEAPAQGQYALGDRGEYRFADADDGAAVLISYSYVPATLEQACLELINERYAYRNRPGQSSVNISGQVVAFRLTDMPDYVRTALAPFRRMVPI